jgi:hypothetical protein
MAAAGANAPPLNRERYAHRGNMKALGAITVVATMIATVVAAIGISPFHETYWFADGVAIGRVVAEQGLTVDIQVEEWVRDRTGGPNGQIRAYRYSEPACVPSTAPAAPYSRESKYLFLVRQPHDAGAEQLQYWSILSQFVLDGSVVCIGSLPASRVEQSKAGCKPNVYEADLLDAVRTFENCFELYDDRTLGTYPVRQTCSDGQLLAWRSRSALHEMLVDAAIKRMQKSHGGA